MSEKDAKAFSKEVEHDDKIFCLIEDNERDIRKMPPTKLKNAKLFKPFEMYTKMYWISRLRRNGSHLVPRHYLLLHFRSHVR